MKKLWTGFLIFIGRLSPCCGAEIHDWDYDESYCSKCLKDV